MEHIVANAKSFAQSWYYPTFAYGKVRGWMQPWLCTDPDVDQIMDRLYLGGISTAYNGEHLRNELGITHVIGCVLGLDPPQLDNLHYKMFPVRDIEAQNMIQYFDEANAYIDTVLAENDENKIYLHCICGVSRSATLLGAYLMHKMDWDAKTAIQFIQSKRPMVNPNDGFRQQLDNFEQVLNQRKKE